MRPNKLIAAIFLAIGTFAAAPAFAGSISFVGMQDASQTKSEGFDLGTKTGTGVGILLGAHLVDRLSLETGALIYDRSWTDSTSGANTLTGKVVQIPLMLQLHLFRWFYIGAGGFYSTNSGALKETGATNNSDLSYSTYGILNNDKGYMADAGLVIPIGWRFALRLEGRYSYGSSNLATASGSQFYTRDMQYLAGLTFYLGGGPGESSSRGSDSPSRR